jgi:enoyl-CoA hydratase/carnithine racemase
MFFSPNDTDNFHRVSFNFIETTLDEHLFTITLDRPEKRNAFTPTMVNELGFALAFAQSNKDIWCILIKANGPVFCAGMDLAVFQDPELDKVNKSLPEPKKMVSLGDAFRLLDKPTIAQVEGAVLAGGFLIVGGCTFVVALEETQFSLPEVKRGLFPMQVISTLLTMTSAKEALRMCILADVYDAHQAKTIGLVSHVASKETINDTCRSLIDAIISNSPFAISKGLQAFRALQDIPEYAKFGFLASQLAEIRASDDAQEGISAFKEKRTPQWKNG